MGSRSVVVEENSAQVTAMATATNRSPAPDTAPSAALDGSRDRRLDFWRGLCLVDMVLVHMVYDGINMGQTARAIVNEYTRFAAGGFIFLAGMAVSFIFLPKALDVSRRVATYRTLGRRALYLLLVHYAVSLTFVLIYPLQDFYGPFPDVHTYFLDVLLFREGCDLLLFYVTMVALSPAILELIRRGYAWAVALLSLSIFTFGQWYPYALSLPIQKDFMVVLWQLVFVSGLLAGVALPKYDALPTRTKVALAALAWSLVALVASAEFTGWGQWVGLSFVKCPLSPGEAIRYMVWIGTLMLTSNLLWRWIGSSTVVAFFASMGRRSLAVYIAHIWVMALIWGVAHRFPGWGAWQGLLAIPAVAMLWSWTVVLDTLEDARSKFARASSKARKAAGPLLGRAFWRISGAALAGVALLFAIYGGVYTFAQHRESELMAKINPPANLAGVLADATDPDDFNYEDVLPSVPPSADPIPDEAEV